MRNHVLLVDDHPGILEALKHYLGERYELAEARNATEMRAHCKRQRFGVAVLDLDLKDRISGFDVIKELHDQECKVVVYTGTSDLPGFKTCLAMGVEGYMDKAEHPSAIARVVDDVLAGFERYPKPMLAACAAASDRLPMLTNRQATVLNMLFRPHMPTNKAISEETKLTEGRISNLLTELYILFGINDDKRGDKYELLIEAKRRGYSPALPMPPKDPRQSDA